MFLSSFICPSLSLYPSPSLLPLFPPPSPPLFASSPSLHSLILLNFLQYQSLMAALGESEEGSSPSTNPVTTATAVPPPSALVRESLTALYCLKCACCVIDHMCVHMYMQAVPHMCTYRDVCVRTYVQAVPHMCTYRDVCVCTYVQAVPHMCTYRDVCVCTCVQAVPHMCTYRDVCVRTCVQAVPHMCTYRDVCVRMRVP